MTLTNHQIEELKAAAKPLMAFMSEHCHLHCKAIIENDCIEIVEGIASIPSPGCNDNSETM